MIESIKKVFGFGSNSYYHLFKGKDGQYYWNLKAANHKVIASSEGYKTKQMALHGIKSVTENATTTNVKDDS